MIQPGLLARGDPAEFGRGCFPMSFVIRAVSMSPFVTVISNTFAIKFFTPLPGRLTPSDVGITITSLTVRHYLPCLE
jgi:hypothetical protein